METNQSIKGMVGLAEYLPKGNINTSNEKLKENLIINIRKQLPQLKAHIKQDKVISLAAGGPSLKSNFYDLHKKYKDGQKVVSLNGSHNWLIEHNINPSVHVMLDARPWNIRFIENPIDTCKYFIASQSDPCIIDHLKNRVETYIYHCDFKNVEEILDEYYLKKYIIVPGGSTVTTRAISLLSILGFHYQDVYGFDSCLINNEHHSYEQKENDGERVMNIFCGDRWFECVPWMAKQAQDFHEMVKYIGDKFTLNVYGDGLISHMLKTASKLYNENKEELSNDFESTTQT